MVAKKLEDLFDDETPEEIPTADEPVTKESKWRSIGVTLKGSEIRELDEIGNNLDVTRNSLLRYAVLKFMREYKGGLITLETEPVKGKRLKMP